MRRLELACNDVMTDQAESQDEAEGGHVVDDGAVLRGRTSSKEDERKTMQA